MILENLRGQEYDIHIAPFIKNGIVIDACVVFELIDGVISTRFSGTKLNELSDYQQILALLEIIKVKNDWSKFYITPHVLTEVFRYLRDKYRKRFNYKDIVKEIFPIFETMGDLPINKSDFLKKIDMNNPVIEAGDISIFVTADGFLGKKQKVAILTIDNGIKTRYAIEPCVLVLDYKNLALNYL